jgi:KaiC/GvpD/RAD55 family RecA-like ATPase
MTDAYGVPELPLSPIRAGTTVLVAGPFHAGARRLGLQLLGGPADEGAIVVTTNRRAERIVEEFARSGVEVARDSAAIIDCVGDPDAELPARLLTVSGPADLTGIGMRFSDVYTDFRRNDIERVRTGLCSVSTLLTFSDLKTVSRFVHTLVGRVGQVDGFGVLLIDPSNHDERAVSTLSQFCDGRIDVRADADDRPELRARGLSDQPRGWQAFEG